METLNENKSYKKAKERVTELKSFYIMIVGYVLLVPFLYFLNIKTSPDYHWFWFPTVCCTISILGYSIYLFAGRNWEERKIQELMEKQKTTTSL